MCVLCKEARGWVGWGVLKVGGGRGGRCGVEGGGGKTELFSNLKTEKYPPPPDQHLVILPGVNSNALILLPVQLTNIITTLPGY